MAEVPSPHLFRRAFHLASPVFLVYYWIPECVTRPDLTAGQCPAAGGLTREGLMLLFLGTALCIEVARIALRIPIFGMRGYEAQRVSAYAWGTVGLALAFVLFPPVLVVPAFCGMAWIDPLCAWARKKGRHPWIPAIAYAAVFASLLAAIGGTPPLEVVALTAVATPVAIYAEHVDIKRVDDDFLMTIAPLVAATLASYAIGLL